MASRLPGNDRILLSGMVFFAVGATLLVKGIDSGSASAFATGLGSVIVAVALLVLAALRIWTRVDWQRVDAEQRLWESGPLGRRWLRLRKLWTGETRPRGRNHE